jgi:hypothetical protein
MRRVITTASWVLTVEASHSVLTTNEAGMHIEEFPVLGVVADDYYECPKDAETADTLDNGILRLYTNANCMEWIHDVGTFPDTTHEIFFAGGTMVATASDGDTLVGRYMGQNDQHSGARDKLYRENCDVDWEPDFSILYTKNIFMHDLNPPADYKWYWWEMSKQVKFFKETAPDVYRHLVIKYVTVRRHDPPSWWPDHDPFTGYEDAYIGVAEDIDCPADTFEFMYASNTAGYDDVNDIAWHKGWDYTGAHPEYNDYYCGIALADGGMPGESAVPYGSYSVRNDVYLYPQGGWGWKEVPGCLPRRRSTQDLIPTTKPGSRWCWLLRPEAWVSFKNMLTVLVLLLHERERKADCRPYVETATGTLWLMWAI